MVELTKKITRLGSTYGILLPKALVECKVFDLGEEVEITIRRKKGKKAFYEIISRNLSY